jgi:hypothetical protein
MADQISIPVKKVNGVSWADLGALALSHEICGESVRPINAQFSFAGGHRVRLYSFKKNVHWKVPVGQDVDISGVEPAGPVPVKTASAKAVPDKKQRRKGRNK